LINIIDIILKYEFFSSFKNEEKILSFADYLVRYDNFKYFFYFLWFQHIIAGIYITYDSMCITDGLLDWFCTLCMRACLRACVHIKHINTAVSPYWNHKKSGVTLNYYISLNNQCSTKSSFSFESAKTKIVEHN